LSVKDTSATVEKSTAEILEELFTGSTRTHGVQEHKGEGKIVHWTKDGPATPEDYEKHWAGTVGLGIVPVRSDGTGQFAAIDIDDDTIDHQQLYQKVRGLKMPLTVCRSKSGGAHLYLFSAEPRRASRLRTVLGRWAGILGYPHAEIFPKQDALATQNKGNWINLPYFGGDSTTRYAVGPDGALTFDEFIASVKFWDGNDNVRADLHILADELPPCLCHLHTNNGGFKEGQRDNGMYNIAVFYRKAQPNGWQDQVREYNDKFCSPPLPHDQVEKIIRSVEGTPGYNYRCTEPPIKEFCEQARCKKMPYGVAGKTERLEFLVSHLRRRTTDPPTYILEVNGQDVELTAEQFLSYPKLKVRLETIHKIFAPPMKHAHWDEERRKLTETSEDIVAPEDASRGGEIMDHVMDFLDRYKNSRDAEDLLMGTPIERDDFIAFKSSDLMRFLVLQRRIKITPTELYAILHQHGATHESTPIKIKGKSVRIWLFPKSKLNIQTEEFTPVQFTKIGEAL
jgi:hypothetical protein